MQFPLDPRSSGKWYEWKASAETPLLVYDPAGTAEVTGAFQLFGNWTFGGKSKTAALDSSSPVAPTPWRDGYEALATLDENADGRISGQELAALALWFDDNRNGRADAGEVRPIQAEGVTALFYSPDKTDPSTRNITASLGYERIVNGELIRGASVDWYGAEGSSPLELVGKQLLDNGCDTAQTTATQPDDFEFEAAAVNAKISLTGAWEWEVEGGMLENHGGKGLIIIEDLGQNGVRGKSLLETKFRKPIEKQSGLLQIISFEGQKELNADGDLTLVFNSERTRGSSSNRKALITGEGRTLLGETQTLIQQGGKTKKLSYRWKAVKRSE